MAGQFHFELVTPERLLLDIEAEHVVLPGSEGEFGVLAGHAPVMSTLRPGILSVYESEAEAPRRYFVKGGFAETAADRLVILAEDALDPASVDRAALERDIRDAEEDAVHARDELVRRRAEAKLAWMRPLKEILSDRGSLGT